MKKMKAGKYLKNIQSKAAYVASKPKDSTYKVDKTDEVFATLPTDSEDEQEQEPNKENGVANKRKKPTKPSKIKRKKIKQAKEAEEIVWKYFFDLSHIKFFLKIIIHNFFEFRK